MVVFGTKYTFLMLYFVGKRLNIIREFPYLMKVGSGKIATLIKGN